MPFLDRPDARLFYTDEGSGPVALLLMHGVGTDSHDWDWVIPPLRDRYRVVAVDLRGHGHSALGNGYALADFANDALAVADRIGCDHFVPVGHSLGGAIAVRLAVEHPDRVPAVVEIDPAYGAPEWVVAIWEEGREQWRNGLGEILKPPPALTTPPLLQTSLDRRREAMDVDAFWATYAGLAHGPEQLFRASPEADDYLRRRACPVLSVNSLPGRAQWEKALFSHPASHALEWEGSSHYLHAERPLELVTVMSGWLAGLDLP